MNKRKIGDKEERIINAAIKIFSQKSFHGTTTKEIAKEAGVAEGTIFRYFDTKKDILSKILEKFIENYAGEIIVESSKELLDKYKDVKFEEFLKIFIKDRLILLKNKFSFLKVVLYEIQFHPDLLKTWIENIARPLLKIMSSYIDQKKEEGEIKKEVDNEVFLRSFIGSVFFVVFSNYALYDKVDFSIDEELDNIINYYINGVRGDNK